MLKWAVNSKRGAGQVPSRLSLESSTALDNGRRRSLAVPHHNTRRKSRRSLHNIDKENLDCAGNTPAFSNKDILGLRKLEFNSGALKDVSNITPNSPTPNSPSVKNSTPNNRRSSGPYARKSIGVESKLVATPTSIISNHSSQPAIKKRRIILDNEIYVDETDDHKEKSEGREKLKTSQENVDVVVRNKKEINKIVKESTKDVRYNIQKMFAERQNLVSNVENNTSNFNFVGNSFEIEYSPVTTVSQTNNMSTLSTLPVIGSRIFINNPLYLKVDSNTNNDDQIPPLKKQKIDFEDNFSRLLNKLSPMSALRHNGFKDRVKMCSEVSPLARRMASLCFNRLNMNVSQEIENADNKSSKSPVKFDKKERISSMKDDEFLVELETKTISDKNTTGEESTITDSKMGDVTLERLIEDILKSTKKVKNARKIRLQAKEENRNVNNNIDDKTIEKSPVKESKESKETQVLESPVIEVVPKSPLVVNNLSQTEVKQAVIKSIKDENAVSLDVKETKDIVNVLEAEKTYIMYDPLDSNEREVKTPENRLSISSAGVETLFRNCSLSAVTKSNPRKRANTIDCTPTLSGLNFNLKRQRCVRKKRMVIKENVDDNGSQQNQEMSIVSKTACLDSSFGLTLKCGIPSPYSPSDDRSLANIIKSHSFNSITSYPFVLKSGDDLEFMDRNSYKNFEDPQILSPTLNSIHFGNKSSPLNRSLIQMSSERIMAGSTKMFGLTLECGIPSPASPFGANRFLDDLHLDTPGFCSSFICSSDCSTQKYPDDSIDRFSEPVTPSLDVKPTRRCLTFSPEDVDSTPDSEHVNPRSRTGLVQSGHLYSGLIELTVDYEDGQISVHIIKCKNLTKPAGSTSINAYVKVNISGVSMYQRTPVKRDCSSPTFDRRFRLPIPLDRSTGHRIQVSVWHRDSQKRRSELLGCISFPVRHGRRSSTRQCIAAGQYRLRSRPVGPRHKTSYSSMAGNTTQPNTLVANGASALDDALKDYDGAGGIAARLAQGQREADENLFLRYLELDPVEGPDAGSAAVQRKASGKAHGRTPFTSTRKLERGSDSGFGFSVLWTRPPRVERVDAGRAAERAGLHPGDYIVFVDRHNVVTMPENQVLNLIKNSGTTLVLETYRRQHSAEPRPQMSMSRVPRGSVTSHATISDAAQYSPALLPKQLSRLTGADSSSGQWKANRPSTACSNNTARSDAAATSVTSKKRPNLPQVAFTRESLSALTNPNSSGPRELGMALHAIILREQHYSQALQFGIERFVLPLASRTDILTANEHKLLFQNCEELLRLSEDILEQLVSEDGDISFHLIPSVYLSKISTITSLYKSYCNGLKRADCVLVQKSRQQGGAFTRLCTEPVVPSRKPDITQFVHKPLEQFRELLRLLRAANTIVQVGHPDQRILNKLVTDLQSAYHDVTASAGIMGPIGEGRPLLSVSDLESRLVFTRCKPFVLSKPGRQWIFGGDLVRVEGRSSRSHWGLLFSDLLLFATVSRDRVLFITEEPLLIANIAETCFNIRKRPTEFRIGVGNGRASSPTARCGPPVRTRSRTIILRAPTTDLKAVWQTLLLRQILRVNSVNGTPLSSPMESPAPLACYSEATLDSQLQHQLPSNSKAPPPGNAPPISEPPAPRPSPSACRGAALHLARWMRTHPGSVGSNTDHMEEPEPEIWSTEQLKRRSQELKLLERVVQPTQPAAATTTNTLHSETNNKSPSENEHSPSRSTNSDSQITVRSSPVVPETVSVCRQCHKKCMSKPNSPQVSSKNLTPGLDKNKNTSPVNNGYLAVNHVCTKNHIPETKIDFVNRFPKENCIAETKITNSPIKNNNESKENDSKEDKNEFRLNHRAAIRKSREEFFRCTPNNNNNNKESCTSPLSRTSKSPSSQSPCSVRSSDSSRSTLFSTNSIMSFAQTTCSSMAFSNSNSKITQSPERDSIASGSSGTREEAIQYVIAQEKYLNEVKCVENIVLNNQNPFRGRSKEIKTYKNVSKTFAETVNRSPLNNSSPKSSASPQSHRQNFNKLDSASKYDSMASVVNGVDYLSRAAQKFTPVNGDIRKSFSTMNSSVETSTNKQQANVNPLPNRSNVNLSWSPLMLMGLSSMNPAAHILALDSETDQDRLPSGISSVVQPPKAPHTSPTRVPNIAVVPPTPDFKSDNKTMLSNQHTLEDSPDDSPIAEDLPYTALKRYGTMSSLEKLPSDELDDTQLGHQDIFEKEDNQPQGLFSWTSRAGSYVAGKMALLNSLAESGAASTGASFLERYLGTGEWRAVRGSVSGAEGSGGEGSGASGEEAWGTPSSGDLSDHGFPDEDHATLSSPTKSSSSCPGDEDTELMMDELLMTPPIAGPSLRPLLPRRRLEPLMEEEDSESSSNSSAGGGSEVTPSPSEKQGSSILGGSVVAADQRCVARQHMDLPLLQHTHLLSNPRQLLADDPELTPTNDRISQLLSSVLQPSVCARRASTPSSTTSERTLPAKQEEGEELLVAVEGEGGESVGHPPAEERLSPRMEMRLALQEGRDILAEQDQWNQVQGHLGWVRRPIPRPCRPTILGTTPIIQQSHTITSHSSVSAQQEEVKMSAMEQLAYLEARGGRGRMVRRIRPAARLMGLVRRRASSNSPERRPYSPRRHQPHVNQDRQLDRRFWKQLRRRSCGSLRSYSEGDHLSLT